MIDTDRLTALMREAGDPEELYCLFRNHDPVFREKLIPAENARLRDHLQESFLQRMDELIERHGIRAFTILDPVYPALLKEIADPPPILFYQGNLDCLSGRLICMVGSRAVSYMGRKASLEISKDLSNLGVSVVSGLADGTDTAAHKGCLEGKSPTVAVTGCGLDLVYPSFNVPLRDEILQKNGLLLSEFAPGEKPIGWHFPMRNRIMTGLCEAMILIEARIRSGSMTSVRAALDQGREVFVYPGDPTSPKAEGNRLLLREGGRFFTSARDVLEDLGWLDNPSVIGQNSECAPASASFTPEERAVIDALRPGPLGFDALSASTGLPPEVLLRTITMLQLHGSVESLPGKIYRTTVI